jgi:hypothetical protein
VDDETELEYDEWMEEGELVEPFTQKPMTTLKECLEGENIWMTKN